MKYILLAILICNTAFGQNEKMGKAFINSLKQNKYTLIQTYIEKEAAKSFKESWNKINTRVSKNKTTLAKVSFDKVVVGKQVPNLDAYFTVITYKYNNVVYDDIFLITNNDASKIYAIPNDTRVLTMNKDRNGRNLKDIAVKDTTIDAAKTIDAFNKMKQLVKNGDTLALSKMLIFYNIDDKTGSWKRTLNYTNASEKISAKDWFVNIESSLQDCSDINIAEYNTDTESEGEWHVLVLKCGFAFAFLKINNEFILADIES